MFSGCGVGVVVGCRIVSVSIFITNTLMPRALVFGLCVCCVILRNVNDFVLSFLFIVFWCCRAFGGCLGAYGPKKDVVACDMPRGIG